MSAARGLAGRLRRLFLDPEPPLVAIELGGQSLGVVHLERRGYALSLKAAVVQELPHGWSPDSADMSAFAVALGAALDRAGALQRTRVALVLPDGVGRLALLPAAELAGKRSREVEEVVRFRLRKLLPFDPQDARVAFELSRNSAQAVVAVVAQQALDPYEAALMARGLQVGSVELAGWVCCGAALSARPAIDRLVVNWDPGGLTLFVCQAGKPVLARHIPGAVAVEPDEVAREVHNTDLYYRDRLGGLGFGAVTLHVAGMEFETAAGVVGEPLGLQPEALDAWRGVGGSKPPLVPRGAELALASLSRWAA